MTMGLLEFKFWRLLVVRDRKGADVWTVELEREEGHGCLFDGRK